MKNFKILKSLLIAIGLLITSVTTPIWAWALWGNFYFSNYSKQWSEVSLCIGDDSGSAGYHLTKLDNTLLWYRWFDISSYGDAYFINANWGDENWWSGWDYRPYGRTYYLSSDDKWQPYKADYNTNKPNGPGKRFYFDGVTNSSKAGDLPTYTAYLRVRFDEDGDGTYNSYWSGGSTWDHGLSFDFTGTYMEDDDETAQSTIHDLNKNFWGTDTWGYGGIPVTGEVTFDLKSLDTGFEIEGWAYDENDATTPVYTDNVNNPTFNVLGNTSYMAFIRRKSYTVTLNDNGGSGGSGSKTVRYDLSTNMTTSVSVPSKTGYDFQGYYTGQDGTGSMVINASGVWQKNVTNYTGTDGSSNPKWVRDDGATLYAKWTQTVTLHDNHGGSNNGSISAIYNGVMSGKSVPTYTDHTLDLGYYAQSGCTNMVMNLDGTLVASVTVSGTKWTSSDSKWIHNGGSTLYAHWKVNAPSSITCTDNVVTIAVPTDATVHYTTNGTTPTASSPTYDPSNKPVIASSGITVKAIAVQSGCTNSNETSQAVTYTPVYTVQHTLSNVTKSSGETSVLENKAYTAVYEDVTGYDLPSTITVTVGGSPLALTTGYTWSVSEGTGTLNILANKITGDVVISVTGDAETYDGTLKNAAGETIGTYTATYGAGTIAIDPEPTKNGYDIGGYYLNYNVEADPQYTNQVATYSKTLLPSVSTYTSSDSKWAATSAPDLIVKWVPHKYTVYLDQQGGAGGSEYFKVEMNSASYEFGEGKAAVMTRPSRTGYTFAGYYTSAAPSGTQIFEASGSVISEVENYTGLSSTWVCTSDFITLYAHWTPVALSFTNGGGDGSWTNTANWDPACVPTSGHDVTINAETTISGSAVAKSVTIEDGGKVTIAATGVLEVEGAVDSDDADKLVINTSSSSQGALICNNSAGTTQATVNLTTQYANGKFQFIAIPLYGVSVASTFSGKGKYTYGWKYGEGWERRGYYDAFTAFEAVLLMGQTYTSFAGALVSTNDFSASLSYDASKVSGDVYMYGNSWTAPIRRSDMTLSGISSINILNGSSNGWDGVVSGDVIPALQGYAAVVGSSGGSISIDYDDAVRNAATPNASLRAPKRNVSDPIAVYVTGNEMQTRIRLFEDEQFTDELDEGYEALYMEGNGYAGELYAMGAKKMNVLATSDLEGTVVGFVPGQATEYTISFAGEGKGYYLNDIEAQESTLISEENTYTFLSGTNDAARFIVSRTPISKTMTGNEAIYDGVKARKQMIDGILYIIRDGRMYDATGVLVK